MTMKKTWISACALALVLAWGAGPALADGLAGTAWRLSGRSKEKVRKVGRQKDEVNGLELYLLDGGTCRLHLEDDEGDVEMPCTWEVAGRNGRRFTLTLDESSVEDLLTEAWSDICGGGTIHDGSVDRNEGRGRVNRKMTRLKLKVVLQATASGTDGEGHSLEDRRIRMRIKLKGVPLK